MDNCVIPQGYKATALGIIPQEWEVMRLGDIVSITSGESPSLYHLKAKGKYPYVKVEDLNNCEKYQESSREYSDDNNTTIKAGSIIFPKRGASILNNKVRIAAKDIQMDSNMMAITPHTAIVDTEFLYIRILHERLYRIADTSSIPQINNKHIIPYKIAVPPLAEQRKIAEVLGVWDEAIEKQARLIEKLALRKRGLMQRLLTGKLRLPNFNEEWRNTIFSSVIEKMSNGYTYDVNGVGNVPITRIETISKGIIDYSKVGNVLYVDELEKYKLHRGDILFSHINSIEHIGKVAIFEGDEDLYHGMNLLLIRTKEVMSNIYLYYFLSSPIAIRKVRSLAKKAVNQASISIAELKKLVIYIPEIKEQTAIAEVLTAADREIELAKEKLEYLRRQKRGLMQQLLTGKKRIKY